LIVAGQSATPKWTELAIGTAIVVPGSSRQNRTGDWRSSRPLWDHDKCIKCGVCVIFCPEGCIGWTQAGYPDGNLEYCKGCGICVRECWTTCIRMKEEEV
jgi:pyruvate ferredoxin oxidoreductase delta subunit